MKISIITVCYNAASVIEECLLSVAAQTYSNIQHIVIDGFSSDGTVDIVKRFPHVDVLVSEKDGGIYDAMNKGLARADGDFVLFLNADDSLFSRDTLGTVVSAINRDRDADVYYGWLEVHAIDGVASVFRPPPPAEAAEFMVCGCLPHQSTLARRSVFERTGPFDLRYRYHADYDWFLKIIADPEIRLVSLPLIIGAFREGGASSQLAKGQPEVFEIQAHSPLYATPDWDRRRLRLFQERWLQESVAHRILRSQLTVSASSASPTTMPMRRGYLNRVRRSAVSLYARLRVYVLQFLKRHLPRQWVELLRAGRTKGRDARP